MVSPNKMSDKRRGLGRHGYTRRYKGNFQFNNVPNINGNSRVGLDFMFCASQIPDNHGYVDFNEPSPPMPNVAEINKSINPGKSVCREKNYNMDIRQFNIVNGDWNNPPLRSNYIPQFDSFIRNYRNPGRPLYRPMIPQMPHGVRCHPPHLPVHPPKRFNLRPNLPLPMRHLCPPLPRPTINLNYGQPFSRGRCDISLTTQHPMLITKPRNIRGGPQQNSNKPPISKNKTVNCDRKRSQLSTRNTTSKKITKKTLKEIVNQYPLDKPWVTNEIRSQQQIKNDIENKLKCNKNDDLFAKFKVQRDKFVTMYEAAKLEYIGKHSEQDIDIIMTDLDTEKDANTKKTD